MKIPGGHHRVGIVGAFGGKDGPALALRPEEDLRALKMNAREPIILGPGAELVWIEACELAESFQGLIALSEAIQNVFR